MGILLQASFNGEKSLFHRFGGLLSYYNPETLGLTKHSIWKLGMILRRACGMTTEIRRISWGNWPANCCSGFLHVEELVGGFGAEKYWSQLGLFFPIYGKLKHVPNHQPGLHGELNLTSWHWRFLESWASFNNRQMYSTFLHQPWGYPHQPWNLGKHGGWHLVIQSNMSAVFERVYHQYFFG